MNSPPINKGKINSLFRQTFHFDFNAKPIWSFKRSMAVKITDGVVIILVSHLSLFLLDLEGKPGLRESFLQVLIGGVDNKVRELTANSQTNSSVTVA